jgi:hypothetical protein
MNYRAKCILTKKEKKRGILNLKYFGSKNVDNLLSKIMITWMELILPV